MSQEFDELQRYEETGHKPPLSLQQITSSSVVTIPQHSTHTLNGKAGYVNIQISRKCHAELGQIQTRTLLRTKSQVVDYLVQTSQTQSSVIPVASLEQIFSDDRPLQLCGGSGEGKSTFVKRILSKIDAPVFLVDIANEYPQCMKLSVGDLYSFKWEHADSTSRHRFVPTNNAQIAASELRTVFSFLNTEKMRHYKPDKVPSGVLAKTVFVIEESHRLARETSFLNFLYESRKHTRKLVAVASDPQLFGRVCRLMRPPPFSELLTK
jgi:hypothetical protein